MSVRNKNILIAAFGLRNGSSRAGAKRAIEQVHESLRLRPDFEAPGVTSAA
jgi:hypothetical protein